MIILQRYGYTEHIAKKCTNSRADLYIPECTKCPKKIVTYNLMNVWGDHYKEIFTLKVYNDKTWMSNPDYLLFKCFVPK